MSRDRGLPLTQGESIWVASAVAVTVMVVLMLLVGLNLQHVVARPVSPSLPVRSALPDLCAVFPGGAAGGLTLRPDPDSRVLDRSESGCSYTVDGGGRGVRRSLRLTVTRPESTGLRFGSGSELEETRKVFRERAAPSPGKSPFRPLPGLGDAAKAAVDTDEFGSEAAVMIRDGVLLVDVRYEVSELGAGEPRTAPATVQDTARRVAAELLAHLPRKGA